MGPLVPDIIPREIDLVFAFFIGIFFGYILEQAGFSTSKKLVGLFYGYDFTVLRVFFTAGLTAMVGIVILTHFGLLDMDYVYINPLFLKSAIIGGLIMGLGFVIGGFCPGTSVCAAAIGKIDAMFFVLGGFLGVIFFSETYSFWEGIYKASYLGNPQLFETLGISRELTAILFIVVAVVAFYFTTKLEKKLNPNEILDDTPKPYYKYILTGVVVLLILIPFLPDKKASLLKKVDDTNFILSQNIPMMPIDEFAYRIWDRDKKLIPVDLRSEKEYKQLQLPYSVNVQEFKQLFDKKLYRKINLRNNQLVFIANDELTEKKAAYIASQIGYKNIFILKKGMPEFIASYINFVPTKIDEHANKLVRDTYRFREMASKELPKIIEENKPKSVTNDKPKRVLGGC